MGTRGARRKSLQTKELFLEFGDLIDNEKRMSKSACSPDCGFDDFMLRWSHR
ncbi:hypothetical protein NXC24_PB00464 (plasmid) [Rhizobium sp. NXC24]|nr:hypothetical protein NXC24_PB00464 [Rhizobium sp. NXC24]